MSNVPQNRPGVVNKFQLPTSNASALVGTGVVNKFTQLLQNNTKQGIVLPPTILNWFHGFTVFSSPGTFPFTFPQDVGSIGFYLMGAGGGGGGGGPSYCGGGGASGTPVMGFTMITPGETVTVDVGAGGGGGVGGSSPSQGGNGNQSDIMAFSWKVISYGGFGGLVGTQYQFGPGSNGFSEVLENGFAMQMVQPTPENNWLATQINSYSPGAPGGGIGYQGTTFTNGSGGQGGLKNANGVAGIQGFVAIWW